MSTNSPRIVPLEVARRELQEFASRHHKRNPKHGMSPRGRVGCMKGTIEVVGDDIAPTTEEWPDLK